MRIELDEHALYAVIFICIAVCVIVALIAVAVTGGEIILA